MKKYYNYSVKHLTTFNIGGEMEEVVFPQTVIEVMEALETDKRIYILGGGSNVLFADGKIEGRLICLKKLCSRIWDGVELTADAGCTNMLLSKEAALQGLSGLEWGVCVPGTIGGAAYMNASYQQGIRHCATHVWYYDRHEQGNAVIEWKAAGKGHRKTIFQDIDCVILSVKMRLKKDTVQNISNRMSKQLARKEKTQPIYTNSAGCIFKNPSFMLKVKLPTKKIGGAEISEVDPRYIINAGGATAKDVLELIRIIEDAEGEKKELEIKLIGFDEKK